jgi:transcriptional regulator with XRE-family HTH domain
MTRPKPLGARIRKARKAAGLTQYELADLLSTTQSQVSEWEHNLHEPSERRYELLKRLFPELATD